MEPYKTELMHDMLRRIASNVEFCAIIFNCPMYCTQLALRCTASLQSIVKAAEHCAMEMTCASQELSRSPLGPLSRAHSLTSSV